MKIALSLSISNLKHSAWKILLIISSLLLSLASMAQSTFTISGPTTVYSGTTVTYSVPSVAPSAYYTWFISGNHGTVKSGLGTNTVTINWTASSVNATLGCTSTIDGLSPQYTQQSIQILAPAPFAAGTISPPVQNINYDGNPATITGSTATGGSGLYTYQWQYATPESAAVSYYWNIQGATSLNYTPPPNLKETTYYRRQDYNSTGSDVTNVAIVNVYQQLVPGTVSPAAQSVNAGAPLTALTCSAPTGGNGTYAYQWQTSSDLQSWTDISSATTNSLILGNAGSNTVYYRVAVSSYGHTAYTSPSSVNINTSGGNTDTPGGNDNCCSLSDKNYISTSTFREAGVTVANLDAAHIAQMDIKKVNQSVQYLDGLGRLDQTVQVRATPLGKDLITPLAYDELGRESVKYQPYAAPGNYGAYAYAAITEQSAFYHPAGSTSGTQQGNGIINTTSPFTLIKFEASPLERVTEQGAPGDDWQPAAGHTLKTAYLINDLTEYVATKYSASIDPNQSRQLTRGTYGAGQLYVTISQDENWTAGSGKRGTRQEYKDKDGRIVLKRTFNQLNGSTALEVLSTYYVYDDLGKLAYVLPPNSNADEALPSQAVLDDLCFQYRYDERGRLTQKKLPGKGWEYLIYNKHDKVVATQDAAQRVKAIQEWTITRYDAMGRVILTGLYKFGAAGVNLRLTVQDQADSFPAQWESATGNAANRGYTTDSFPSSISTIFSVNYYDNYLFAGVNPYTYDAGSTMTRGLLTGSLTNVLGTTDMLWHVVYYDDNGREVKTYQQHYLGGTLSPFNYDEITSAYNFSDQITATTRKHYVKNAAGTAVVLELTISNGYNYDHIGRKAFVTHQVQNGTNLAQPAIILSASNYNELGQLTRKKLHGNSIPSQETLPETLNLNSVYSGNNNFTATRSITLSPGFNVPAGSVFRASIADNTYLQVIDYRYNERGWLTQINDPAATPTTTKLFAEQLNYNSTLHGAASQYNGNIAEQSYKIYDSPTPGLQTVKYTYDDVNRLTDGVSSTGFSETSINYDKAGNLNSLTRSTAPNAVNLSYNYNGNQLNFVNNGTTSFRNYSYDENGNATSDGQGNAITFNVLNLPQAVPSKNLTYVYDASGQKLRKLSGSVTTEYVSGIQYNGATIDFIQTEEGRVINSGGSYKYEYVLTDHLGNNRTTLDQTNGKVGEDDYYPFGLNVHRLTNAGNKYLYNKKELQEELSQYDYGARFYDPVIGRWTSVDPSAEEGDQESLTPYQYGLNNPIRYDDPDGRCPTCITGLIGAGIGALSGAIIEGGSQLYHNGRITSWKAVGGAAVQGGVVGGVAGLTGGASLLATTGATAGANVVGGLANRTIQGQKTTIKDVAVDAAVGAAIGAGGKLLDKALKGSGQAASKYDQSITGKNSVRNVETDVTSKQFGKNLEKSGYEKAVTKDGRATTYTKGDAKYSVRESPQTSRGTPGPSAEYSNGTKQPTVKIRLNGGGN